MVHVLATGHIFQKIYSLFASNMNTTGKKYHPATIVLLVLVGWRLWGQFEYIMASMGALIMFIAYLVALIGILLRRKWGVITSGLLAIMDIPIVLFVVGGAGRIGAFVVDLIIIYLAYENYKLISAQKSLIQDLRDDGENPTPET
jgi:hypothetical protein